MTQKEAENIAVTLLAITDAEYAEYVANNAISAIKLIRETYPKIDDVMSEIEGSENA